MKLQSLIKTSLRSSDIMDKPYPTWKLVEREGREGRLEMTCDFCHCTISLEVEEEEQLPLFRTSATAAAPEAAGAAVDILHFATDDKN